MTIELTPEKKDRVSKYPKNQGNRTRFENYQNVRYGWLYTKQLERDEYLALEHSLGNYEAKRTINEDSI